MPDKMALLGSFGSLLDTLRTRFDHFQPQSIRERWLGLTGRAAAVAGNVDGWRNLPDQSDRYDGLISLAEGGTRSLVVADYSDANSVSAALDEVERAVEALEALLGA